MIAEFVLAMMAPVCRVEDGWLTDFDTAMNLGKQESKPVMVDFTGSDWCTYCFVLHGEVFATSAFKEWAEKNVILVKLDYPRNKVQPGWVVERNVRLKEKYGVDGFPAILFLNKDGKVFGRHGVMPGAGPGPWLQYADQILSNFSSS